MLLSHNLIAGNEAEYRGAGVIVFYAEQRFINNTITANTTTGPTSTTLGAGITVFDGEAAATGFNNIVYGNYAGDDPDCSGIVSFDYSLSSEALPGTGNISEDPLFRDPGNFDFHLTGDSPCIDAGDPTAPLDPDGTRADMGAFPYDQSTGVAEPGVDTPDVFTLFTCYPNPFNPTTTLSFNLASPVTVRLTVHNIEGRLVTDLIHAEFSQGHHEVRLDAGGLTSGIYFAYLQTGNISQILKLMLVK